MENVNKFSDQAIIGQVTLITSATCSKCRELLAAFPFKDGEVTQGIRIKIITVESEEGMVECSFMRIKELPAATLQMVTSGTQKIINGVLTGESLRAFLVSFTERFYKRVQ